jgi:hypothetical protein
LLLVIRASNFCLFNTKIVPFQHTTCRGLMFATQGRKRS